jgi:ubiquitin-conjugating enzyme E2 variant
VTCQLAVDKSSDYKPKQGAGVFGVNIRPYFLESSLSDRTGIRVCVGTNLFIIVVCSAYLAYYFQALPASSWPFIVAAVVVGYFVADFVSGLVHWGMDTWFDESSLGRCVAIAREHHTHPQNVLGYDFWVHAALGSASGFFVGPIAVVTALFPVSLTTYSLMIIWFVTSTCLFFGTSFHNLCHRPSKSRLIRFAQKIHLVIPTEHHWVHHRGDQTIHYCVINGWANYVCDPLHVWRGLEWLVHALTGAEPRRDDLIWQRRYKETGSLVTPQK